MLPKVMVILPAVAPRWRKKHATVRAYWRIMASYSFMGPELTNSVHQSIIDFEKMAFRTAPWVLGIHSYNTLYYLGMISAMVRPVAM